MAQDREGRVAGPAEVWGLARAETKAPVAADKVNGPGAVVVAARAVDRGRGRVAPLRAEQTDEMNSRTF